MIKTTDSDFTLGIEVYEKEQGAVPIDIKAFEISPMIFIAKPQPLRKAVDTKKKPK